MKIMVTKDTKTSWKCDSHKEKRKFNFVIVLNKLTGTWLSSSIYKKTGLYSVFRPRTRFFASLHSPLLRLPNMQIYCNKRKCSHKKRVQLPKVKFGTPKWPPFHCFRTPILPPWCHVKTLYHSIHETSIISSISGCWKISPGGIYQGSKFKFEFGSTCATRCKFLGALPKF